METNTSHGEDSSSEESSSSAEIRSSVEESSSTSESTLEESSSQPTYYIVTFVNYDGSKLYEVEVQDGQDATYEGQAPTRKSDDNYTYTFKGWDKELTNITSDTTIQATYDSQQTQWSEVIWIIY